MSPVLRDIKKEFEKYLRHKISRPICYQNPFKGLHWMHHYLIPETLMVFDDYYNDDSGSNFAFKSIGYLYPCWVCSEEQVLRIMAEHGLL